MKQKRLFLKILAAALAVTAMAGTASVAFGVNTSSDPLVTLSYLTGTYKTNLLSEVQTAINARQKQLSADFTAQLTGLQAAPQDTAAAENAYRTVTLSADQTAQVDAGGEVLFLSGSASVTTAGLTDTTAGAALGTGAVLTANHLYVAAAACTIQASGAAKLLVK